MIENIKKEHDNHQLSSAVLMETFHETAGYAINNAFEVRQCNFLEDATHLYCMIYEYE